MKDKSWTPFNPDGTVRVTFNTDPWWKRLTARLRRQPIWHQLGTHIDKEQS